MTEVPRLHLISNRTICPVQRFPEVARAAVSGGVGAVHVREPDLPAEELRELVRVTREALSGTGARVLVNSRVDIAVVTGSDGVHLPERGTDPVTARAMLLPGCLVGVSAHSVDAARSAEAGGADYVAAGHVFATASKPGLPGRGLEFISDVTSAVDIPVIAIGGITAENAGHVLSAGAHGVAVISAILAARDPAAIASEFVQAMDDVEVKR